MRVAGQHLHDLCDLQVPVRVGGPDVCDLVGNHGAGADQGHGQAVDLVVVGPRVADQVEHGHRGHLRIQASISSNGCECRASFARCRQREPNPGHLHRPHSSPLLPLGAFELSDEQYPAIIETVQPQEKEVEEVRKSVEFIGCHVIRNFR